MLIASRIIFWIGLVFFASCGIAALVKVILDKRGSKKNYK